MKNIVGDQIRARMAETTRDRTGGLLAGELIIRISWEDVIYGEPSEYVEWCEATLTEYKNRTGMTALAR